MAIITHDLISGLEEHDSCYMTENLRLRLAESTAELNAELTAESTAEFTT